MSFSGLDSLPFVYLRQREDNTFLLKLNRDLIREDHTGLYTLFVSIGDGVRSVTSVHMITIVIDYQPFKIDEQKILTELYDYYYGYLDDSYYSSYYSSSSSYSNGRFQSSSYYYNETSFYSSSYYNYYNETDLSNSYNYYNET